MDKKIYSIARFLAKTWFRDQCQNLNLDFYLWYKPTDPNNGVAWHPIVSATMPNKDWKRSILIPSNWDENHAGNEIARTIKTLPILDNTGQLAKS